MSSIYSDTTSETSSTSTELLTPYQGKKNVALVNIAVMSVIVLGARVILRRTRHNNANAVKSEFTHSDR